MTLLVLTLAAALGAQQPETRIVDLAIFPLEIEGSHETALRAVAESCIVRLAQRLATQGVSVVRRPASVRGALRSSHVARFAIDGTIERVAGKYSVTLGLLDPATDEELRSYFYSGTESAELYHSGELLAARLAKVIREP